MKRTQIAPGAYIQSVPGEKFKRCKIVFHMVAPATRAGATALALLPSVLERRCEAIPDPTLLSRRLFDLYGAELSTDSYTLGANRVLSLAVSGLKNEFALAGEDLAGAFVQLACDLLFAPKLAGGVFESEDVEIEKEKQSDYLKSEMNDKRSYCVRQARRKLFGDSALGIESGGYLEELPAITPAGLYEEYTAFLKNAAIEVIVSGMEADAAAEAIARRLEGVRRAPAAPNPVALFQTGAPFARFTEPMDTVQGKLCVLLPGAGAREGRGEAVLRVANAVLGGLPSSRLFTNVREKQSLCYYCASSYSSFSGVLGIDSGVDHQNAERASEAILAEFTALQNAPVSDWELDAAHLALTNAFDTAKDHADALANWVFLEQMRGSNLSLDEMGALVASVTAEEIREALCGFTPKIEYVITGKEGA